MVLAGFTMHRVANAAEPRKDTELKLAAARPRGAVLDTCCGLGYTAIGAARLAPRVASVTTIELDDVSLAMCAHNPWSRELFVAPDGGGAADGECGDDVGALAPIEVLRGDAGAVVAALPAGTFSCVIHDPPARALCKEGDLYGVKFYGEVRDARRCGSHRAARGGAGAEGGLRIVDGAHEDYSVVASSPPRDAERCQLSDASRVASWSLTNAHQGACHDPFPPARVSVAHARTHARGGGGGVQLRRVLQTGGTLYHYIGNPDSTEGGRLFSGVCARLADAGFNSVSVVKGAFGVTAKA